MKKSLKKGGVGDVVTLIIIIGLALALIVAVIVPNIQKANEAGNRSVDDYSAIDTAIGNIKYTAGSYDL